MRFTWKALALAAGLALAGGPAAAAGISSVIVFGDSNVDDGNLAARGAALGITINPPPNFGGRNNNGPVVVEYLAEAIHRPLLNFAFSGAATGTGLNFGLATNALTQIEGHLAARGGLADPDAIYVYWAGSNDLIGVGSNAALLAERIATATANIETALETLDAAGATRILVANRTPRPSLTSQDNLNGIALNAAIAALLPAVQATIEAEIWAFDNYALIADMVTNPARYGFARVAPTDLCLSDPACETNLAEAEGWVNWDSAHKTTRVHELMALAIVEQFALPVPAPAALAVLLPGLVALAGLRLARARHPV